MNDLMNIFKVFGIPVTEESSAFLQFISVILLLNSLALICLINIVLYFLVLLITENKNFLNKFTNWPVFLKIINIYRKTRIGFLVIEFFFLF